MPHATTTQNSWKGANLSGETLTGANLFRSDLVRATLAGADISTARSLAQEELEGANADENTRLPPEIDPPAHWGVKSDESSKEDRAH